MENRSVGGQQRRQYHWVASIPFFLVHILAVVGVVLLGWSWKGFALAIALYYVRMFGVTGGYHRYFSHRTYRTSRWFQFVLAVLAQTSLQKGALWWAAHHRDHHKFSDTPNDPHSFRNEGFWHSHVGWILQKDTENTDYKKISDFARYPELVWLNKYHAVPGIVLGVTLWLIGSWPALVWGLFVSTSLLWHGTFTINSLSHWFGSRRYATTDESKNNFILALVTMGEGWHNNHHHYQRSCAQGFFWWEIDMTFYVLKALSWVGLVKDIQTAPAKIKDGTAQAHIPTGSIAKVAAAKAAEAAAKLTEPVPSTVEAAAE
jgi:stearoyl-CoA desaturase (delta-9 desaturase)